MPRPLRLEDLEIETEAAYTVFGPNLNYNIIRRKTGKTIFIGKNQNEVENYLRANVELPSDAVLATKTITEAIARAFTDPSGTK